MEDVLMPSLGSFIVACACATLGMMVTLSFVTFHVYHRNNRVVKMTSPVLNVFISFGTMLLNITSFLYGLDFIISNNLNGLSALCQVRAWLMTAATSFLFGPVIAKSWRVYQIFKYGTVRRVVIKDTRLIVITICIVIIDLIIMLLWHVIDPLLMLQTRYNVQTQKPEDVLFSRNVSTVLQECVCQRFPIWVAIICLWKLVIIIQALVLAWKIRNVTIPTLNDSSSIIAAIFGTILLSFVGLMTSSAFFFQLDAVYIMSAVLIAACSVWIQIILFLPKIHYWWKNSDEYVIRISSASIKGSSDGNDSSVDNPAFPNGQVPEDENANLCTGDGIQEILQENKTLKQSLLEKQDYIITLQKHLDIAKEKLFELPDETVIKQDSGLEIDIPANTDSAIYETLRTPVSYRRLDRSSLYRVDRLNSVEDTDFESLDEAEEQSRPGTKLKYCPSVRSSYSHQSFVEEFTDIRNSVAAAQAINIELKDAYEKDFRRSFSETEWLYEAKDNEDLANSITQSYDLDNNKETISYLSSYIPRENSVYQVRNRKRSSSVISITSSETFSQASAELENSNVPNDITASNRENMTPNSQQHAAILRYYSYRHMNDKFNRHMVGRFNPSMKEKYCPKLVLQDQANMKGDAPARQGNGANVLGRRNLPTDSFV